MDQILFMIDERIKYSERIIESQDLNFLDYTFNILSSCVVQDLLIELWHEYKLQTQAFKPEYNWINTPFPLVA